MRIDIITCLPKLLEDTLKHSIINRALTFGVVNICVHDLREFSKDKHKKVDDYLYGGGAGMLLMIEPLVLAIEHIQNLHGRGEVVYMAPDGELLNQKISNQFSLKENIIIICGHYKGIDERVRQHFVTREISIGDYVLTGGELPAAVFIDSIVRLIPGAISDETSALFDSFQDNLVAPPCYTRPENFRDLVVPEILLSGHEMKIDNWRFEQSINRTKERRPHLLDENLLDELN